MGRPSWSDAEIDYAYNAARAVGARGIPFEGSDGAAQRMGPFATRHELYNGMHNHTQVGAPDWSFDRLLSPRTMRSTSTSVTMWPARASHPFRSSRNTTTATHPHLKDRRTPANGADDVAWGEGDTSIAEALRLIQREGYPITAMIELEYPIPETSDVLTEVAKCVGFCRGALS